MSGNISGTVIGPYQLVQQLGEGGMGVVYHAQQLQPIRRDVALKVIKPGMDSKQVIARFESERQALALMDHPSIARVFDAGATDRGLPYFVMELVDGTPITRYCDAQRLTLKERVELFIPVCQAIQHAHQRGIIHRDIKPSNILVKQHEGQAVPKVIDFGLAKALGQQMSDATVLTSAGTVVGTFYYMSPEQAELGRHDVDTRSDVYSLGAVLYELLTGTTPLERERLANASYVEALQFVREEEARAPSMRLRKSDELRNTALLRRSDPARLPKLLQRELDWIVLKALEKDRARRYETVNGMARDLERFLQGEPVEAAPPSATYRVGKFVRKHRVWLTTAAAFAALLVAGAVVSSWMAVRASRAQQEARAVSEFLQDDVLAQASANQQARPGTRPDPDLKVRTALDRAAARIEGKFRKQPLVEASIRETIGRAYRDLGLYREAQTQAEHALALRRQMLGERQRDTLASMNDLALALIWQGRYEQAEPLVTRLLGLRRDTLGAEDPDTLRSMVTLGLIYYYRGKYAPAETIEEKALEASKRIAGEENPETLQTMVDLAATYKREAKYAQAEPLYTAALKIRRRVSGPEHPETLLVMNNLASLYFDQGKYSEAEPLYREAFEIRRRVLGEAHPDTLQSMNNLALLSAAQGKYSDAEPLYEKTLEARRRVSGERHISTMIVMLNLAALYDHEGKPAQAIALFQTALQTERSVLGEEHDLTLTTMKGLADAYRSQSKFAQADALYTSALGVRRRVSGAQHPATVNTLAALGQARLLAGKHGEAESILREALQGYEKAGLETWERYQCQSMLGASLVGQKKLQEAEPLLVAGYDGLIARRAAIPAESRPVLRTAGERIVRLYSDWGKPDKASEWKAKVAVAGKGF
jgi:non-specific serine/threonine protein kinase/serine/threonine-protein kinase